jgi:LPS-assembly protein
MRRAGSAGAMVNHFSGWDKLRLECAFAALALLCLLLTNAFNIIPASAQNTQIQDKTFQNPAVQSQTGALDPERMLIEAASLVYNKDDNSVAAQGEVQIYYKGRILQADKVTYNRTTGRVLATGNAKITEADGSVTYGDRFDLTDNFRDGFIDSVRIISKDKTRMTSPHAERVNSDIVNLDKATYTACEPCKDHPERAPVWQVHAVHVIHNSKDQMIYFEQATIEVFGIPVLWLPYMSTPDSTVQRKTGFLGPHFIDKSALGFGMSVPFFWNLAPNYDLTLMPALLTRQGFFGEAQWRHRLEHGEYDIRVSGISPAKPSDFEQPPTGAGNLKFRGSIETNAKFLINPNWSFGWNIAVATDKFFYSDFNVPAENLAASYFKETTSSAYLHGQSDRAYFDLRGYGFQGLSSTDYQKELPLAAPVLDYHKTIDLPKAKYGILGGEVGIDVNMTSISREAAAFQSTVSAANGTHLTDSVYGLYDVCKTTAGAYTRDTCLLRGMAGNTTRFSAQFDWRKQLIDPIGQVWTPFVYGRADLAAIDLNKSATFDAVKYEGTPLSNASQSAFFSKSQSLAGRAMPAVGLEYRYPFVAKTNWATHTIEPIAQVIVRPNEQAVGSMPNEDAQSLVFDDTNLFAWNKFSGYDRSEGGVRLNAGAQYTMAFNRGGFANIMAGESFQLSGANSFTAYDVANTGADSGLQTAKSDYIGKVAFAPSSEVSFIAKGRFDEATWATKRLDLIANFTTGPINSSVSYGRYAPQPLLGFTNWREGVALSSKYKMTDNWSVNGQVVFDLARWKLVPSAPRFSVAATGVGLSYGDECTTLGLNYITTVLDPGTGTLTRNQTFLFQLNLRTLGDAQVKTTNINTATDGIATH